MELSLADGESTVLATEDAAIGGTYDGSSFTLPVSEPIDTSHNDSWEWASKQRAKSNTLIGHEMCDRCIGMGTHKYMEPECWDALVAAYEAR